jgi:hypothetical protein
LIKEEMTCNYGITLMAEANGDLGIVCDKPVTRNIKDKQDDELISLDVCEGHYQGWLIWESQRVEI